MNRCNDTIGVVYFEYPNDMTVVWGDDEDGELVTIPVDFLFIPIWGNA